MHHNSARQRVLGVAAIAAVAALALAGCVNPDNTQENPPATGSSGGATSAAPTSPRAQYVLTPDKVPSSDDTVVIWTDDTRRPGFEKYQAAHPDVKLDIQVVPGDQILTKIQLANSAGSGWPDVLWSYNTSYPSLLASEQYDYFLQPYNGIIDDTVLKGFGDNNAPCTYEGYVYCLRNDIAPAVMFYSTTALQKLGAEVPKTMDDLVALAEKAAAADPDYRIQINGDAGSSYLLYLMSSGCPYASLQDDGTLKVDLTDPTCVRAGQVLDKLISTGVFRSDTLSDQQKAAIGSSDHLLATINAVWRQSSVPKAFGIANGTWGVAPVPTWGAGDANNRVGNEGGGGYLVSRHAKNMKAALDIAQFMSTDKDWVMSESTFTAYEPLQEQWLSTYVPQNAYLADPAAAQQVYLQAAKQTSNVVGWVSMEPQGDWPLDDVKAGKGIVDSVLATFASKLKADATSVGYTVTP